MAADPTKRAGLTPLGNPSTRATETPSAQTEAFSTQQPLTSSVARKKVESPWADPQVLKTVHANFDRILQGVNQSSGVRVAKFGEIPSFEEWQQKFNRNVSAPQGVEPRRAVSSSTAVATAGNPNIRRLVV